MYNTKNNTVVGCFALFLSALALTAHGATPAPKIAEVDIISPAHGEVVSSPVTVKFGLSNMGVAPAGVDKANTGHHHLLINLSDPPALDKPLPADKQHVHFGGGQTQTVLQLPPGEHTLQLLMGDMNHIPHSPPVLSDKISIVVQ